MPPTQKPAAHVTSPLLAWFSVAFGVFLGLSFLKFPNPPILDHLAAAPQGFWEWLLVGWPVRYAYPCLAILAITGLWLVRWPRGLNWRLGILPLAWLGWVVLSCAQSIDRRLSGLTLVHFIICVICFYIGLTVVGRVRHPGRFFAGLIGGLVLVIATGWQQHFGGLEETRNYFYTYIYPNQPEVPPELLKRMESERIFSTLFYPNSLAGLLLLVTPAVLGLIADARNKLTPGARWLLACGMGAAAGGCLVWSGSKAGWLLAMLGGVVALMRLPIRRSLKVGIIALLLVAGIAGFTARYLGFFKSGATSVVARYEYWNAAWQNLKDRPFLGSGPGTFATVFQRSKPPEAEMARLTHNDYLQQASDSGLAAGLLFVGLVFWVFWSCRSTWTQTGWAPFGATLGMGLFAIQSLVEFGFYVPATAWTWFGMAGWLIGRVRLGFDNPQTDA